MSSTPRSSAARNGREPSRKKKKTKKPSPVTEPISISSLPYDLLLNCLARVSRSYYQTLSRVSKQFRSIVSSPELYDTRSLLHRTESCLYLCLSEPFDPNTYWFTLCKKSNRNRFVQIPSPDIPPSQHSALVAAGSNIYKIGGDRPSSSRVSVLDCRTHKWHRAPRMRMKRNSCTASLVSGKIFVAGGCEDHNSLNWVEVFDPKTETWGNVKNLRTENHDGGEVNSLGLEGKFYLFGDDDSVVYDPEEDEWNSIGLGVDREMGVAAGFSHGVIDNVLFFWYDGVFEWYDFKVSSWKKLNGVEGLPDFKNCVHIKMVDLGGNMAVLWDEFVYSKNGYKRNRIWCAEIALERRDGDEIWGKVEWSGVVLNADGSCRLLEASALSIVI